MTIECRNNFLLKHSIVTLNEIIITWKFKKLLRYEYEKCELINVLCSTNSSLSVVEPKTYNLKMSVMVLNKNKNSYFKTLLIEHFRCF